MLGDFEDNFFQSGFKFFFIVMDDLGGGGNILTIELPNLFISELRKYGLVLLVGLKKDLPLMCQF